jgi:hypothetical protein
MNEDSAKASGPAEEPEEIQPALPPEVEAGEATIWATLGRDLDARGSSDAKPFLSKQLKARHDKTVPIADLKVVSFTILSRYSSYSATNDPNTGAQTSMVWEKLATNPGMEMTIEEGVKLAITALSPPPDARLETAEYDTAGEDPFMVVRWAHFHEGVKVEKDFLQAMINGRRRQIFAWHRRWHQVSPNPRQI